MSLTKVQINLGTTGNLSGSRSLASGSLASRITTAETELTNTILSSSVQIGSDISGSFGNQRVGTTDSPTFNAITVGTATVTGTLTAQEVHTEFESASILFTSGSTQFGNSSDDVHDFLGNTISGSATSTGSFGSVVVPGNVDFNANLDVDGTTNLDVVDIDGAVDMASTLDVGGDVTITSATSEKPRLTIINTNADASAPQIRFQKDSSSPADNDEVGRIYMFGDDDAGNATEAFLSIGKLTDVSNGSEDSNFDMYTYAGGSQKLTLSLSSGNVGIGTDGPSAKLHVAGGSGNDVELHLGDGDGDRAEFIYRNDADFEIRSTGATGNFELHNEGNRSIIFNTNGSERMRIVGGGSVGIGTDSPVSGGLHIHTDASTEGIYLKSEGNTRNNLVFDSNISSAADNIAFIDANWNETNVARISMFTGTDTSNKDDGRIGFATATAGTVAERMRIESNGNVGISTTNPGSLLHVYAADGVSVNTHVAQFVNLEETNGDSEGVFIRAGNASNDGALEIQNRAGDTTMFKVTGDKNVGIGTASPDAKFHVYMASDSEVYWGQDSGGVYQSVGTNQHMRFLYDNGSSEVLRFLDGGGILTHSKTRATLTAGKTYASGANVITFTVTVNNVSSWEPINFLVEANYTTANLGAQGYFYGWGHTYHYSASGLGGTSTGQGGASSNITVAVGNYSSNSFDVTVTSATTSGTINMVANLDIRARHGITNITAA